jgi:hypothetical protein
MTTKEKIAVMQAYLDGRPIQLRCNGGNGGHWADLLSEPMWTWGQDRYRIKPEPREWWLELHKSFTCWGGHTSQQATVHKVNLATNGGAMIKVREVLE